MALSKKQKSLVLSIALFALAAGMAGSFVFSWLHNTQEVRIKTQLKNHHAFLMQPARAFSDFTLTTHLGQPFHLNDLKGKWSFLFFGFTSCPDVCPTTLAILREFYKQLDQDLQQQTQVMMLSVDPERDTTEKLAQYVPYFHPDFIGLTSNPGFLLSLATQLNIVYQKVPFKNSDDYSVDHSANIVLIDPAGKYHAFFTPEHKPGTLKKAYALIRDTYQP